MTRKGLSINGAYRQILIFCLILTTLFTCNSVYAEPIKIADAAESFLPIDSISLPDLTNDGYADRGLLYYDSVEDKLRFQLINGVSLSKGIVVTWSNIYDNPSLHLLPDLNGNGVPEIAVFGVRNEAPNVGKPQLFARDLSTGANVRVFNWPANWTSVSPLILDDMTGDGLAEVAIQGRFKEGNRPQLILRNGATGAGAGVFSYPDLFDEPEFFQHSDTNGDNIAEVTTFGRIKRNNKIQIKLADGTNPGNRLGAYNFPDKWSDVEWLKLDDTNSDGVEDWGLFGINKDDNRPQLIVKDGTTTKGAIRIFAWSPDLSAANFYPIPDMNNDGVNEVAVGGVRSNGRHQFQVKDGADRNASLANHNINLSLSNVSYHVLTDLTADGVAEIGFLGTDASSNYILQVQNGTGIQGTVTRYNLGANWTGTPSLKNIADINNDGLNEIMIEGNYAGQAKLQIWAIPDTDSDGFADTADVFPDDDQEWLDTDGDTIGNNTDNDDDGDGVIDTNDAYPLISVEDYVDTDNDGIPDNCDQYCIALGMVADDDDDGNGVPDDASIFAVGLGSQAPGLDNDFAFTVFREIEFGSDGQMAVIADARNASNETVTGVWLGKPESLRLVIKTDDNVPGLDDNILLDTVGSLSLNGKGEVMFSASLKGAVTTSTQYVLLYANQQSLQQVTVELPQELIEQGFYPLSQPGRSWFELTDAGAAITLSIFGANFFNIAIGSATWFWTLESSTLVLGSYIPDSNADTALNLPLGGIGIFDETCIALSHFVFLEILTPQVNNQGDIAFRTDMTGDDSDGNCPRAAIIKWNNGTYTNVVEQGQAIPNMEGESFSLQSNHVWDISMLLTDTGDIAFLNSIRVSLSESIIGFFVAKQDGSIEWLMSNGERIQDEPSSSLFLSFEQAPQYSSSLGFIVPLRNLTDLSPVIIAGESRSNPYESVGDIDETHLSVLLRPGDVPPDFPTTSYFSFDSDTYLRSSINTLGNVLFYETVKDVTQNDDITAAGLWKINSDRSIQEIIQAGDEVFVPGSATTQKLAGIGAFKLTDDNKVLAYVGLDDSSVGVIVVNADFQ
jgi:hypothetical protein